MAAHFDSILHVSPELERQNGGVAGQFDDADEDDDMEDEDDLL